MQKLILVLVIGILTFSFGGCGSPEEAEETETIEQTTPAETEGGAEPNQQDDEDGKEGEEQSQLEEFEDPLVEEKQKQQAAAEAGLIQSTKAEERLLQLKGSSNGTPQPTARPTDPFSVLPPLVVQGTPDEDEPAEVASSLEINARQVPELPALPVAAAPPPWQAVVAVDPSPSRPQPSPDPGNNQPTPKSPSGPSNNQPTPKSPSGPSNNQPTPKSPSGSSNNQPTPKSPSSPRNQPTPKQPPRDSRNQQTPPESPTPVATSLPPAQIPSLPQLPTPPAPADVTPVAPPIAAPPAPPPLQVATIPELPNLPASESPVAWVDPNPPVIAEPPPPPSTTLAEAIAVTGVVRTGSQTRVILKAPTEPTSRYVSVGQTVANGEVLVKRVKFSPESDPIVIFEQNGVEVARVVGSTPQTEEEVNLTVPPPPTVNAFNKV
jgi:hypothetical protein